MYGRIVGATLWFYESACARVYLCGRCVRVWGHTAHLHLGPKQLPVLFRIASRVCELSWSMYGSIYARMCLCTYVYAQPFMRSGGKEAGEGKNKGVNKGESEGALLVLSR